jgi:hypothetical protein
MTIKVKLAISMLVVPLILDALSVFFVFIYRENNRQSSILCVSLDDLDAVRKTCFAIVRQITQPAVCIISGNQNDMAQYKYLANNTRKTFDEWKEILNKSALPGHDKKREEELARRLDEKYTAITWDIERI